MARSERGRADFGGRREKTKVEREGGRGIGEGTRERTETEPGRIPVKKTGLDNRR